MGHMHLGKPNNLLHSQVRDRGEQYLNEKDYSDFFDFSWL